MKNLKCFGKRIPVVEKLFIKKNEVLGTVLVGDMFRYLSNVTPMRIAVEVHDDFVNKDRVRKWIERYGFSKIGKPSKHTTGFALQMNGPTGHKDIFEKGDFSEYAKYADLNSARGEIITEQELNLTDFYMYHALFPIKGKNPKDSFNWDIDQYYKTIDSAIHNEICHSKNNNIELGDRFSLWMYTLYDENSSMYLGKIAVYMHDDEFDWEWEEQETLSTDELSAGSPFQFCSNPKITSTIVSVSDSGKNERA